ncbi:MAG TPA: hypothetical protein VFL57_08910 [Bryobacteraceae bacterium]|nr:hypothetical protein [Bryobacteraceae bacterium]
MTHLVIGFAAAALGWVLGTRSTRRTIAQELDRRVADLELRLRASLVPPTPAQAAPIAVPKAAPAPAAPPVEEISTEILAVLSAAVCAYLGKPARIRRVRRVQSGFNPWAQQGRVYVMGSHALSR